MNRPRRPHTLPSLIVGGGFTVFPQNTPKSRLLPPPPIYDIRPGPKKKAFLAKIALKMHFFTYFWTILPTPHFITTPYFKIFPEKFHPLLLLHPPPYN